MSIPDHLAGPWTAYLLDEDGFAYTSAGAAAASRADELYEFQVAIVRRSATPKPVGAGQIRLCPMSMERDIIWVAEDPLPLLDNDRYPAAVTAFGAAGVLDRAVAMARGLNAVEETA